MSRILFAWELGANLGHLARDLPVAERLRDDGHEIAFAVRDTRTAAQLLTPKGFPFTQSPLCVNRTRLAEPPANYAEMLAAEGWCDKDALLGHLQAWMSVIRLGRFDAVVADHAPGALIAAHILEMPGIPFGSGFEIPPDCEPMPGIRPWDKHSAGRLLSSERRVLGHINAAIAACGGKPYERLGQIFAENAVLSTFPELDHYGARCGGRYVGSIHGLDGAAGLAWPATGGPRVLAYLRPHHPIVGRVMEDVAMFGANAVCVVPGAGQEFVRRHQRESIAVSEQPVALGPLLKTADILVCHGGIGTVSEAMLAGVPLLMIPSTVEQCLAGRCVESLGAGVVVADRWGGDVFRCAVSEGRQREQNSAAVREFAKRYSGWGPQSAIRQTAAHVIAVLS
ncbi:hypothetical protein RHDC4_00475 [Rhodocyclaceae bacterium]|nr:hypothetical protein RHDC4_00475 [Rhodocyclaceae bacterium]